MGNSQSEEYIICKENKLNKAMDAKAKYKKEYHIYIQYKNEKNRLYKDADKKCRTYRPGGIATDSCLDAINKRNEFAGKSYSVKSQYQKSQRDLQSATKDYNYGCNEFKKYPKKSEESIKQELANLKELAELKSQKSTAMLQLYKQTGIRAVMGAKDTHREKSTGRSTDRKKSTGHGTDRKKSRGRSTGRKKSSKSSTK